jgi:hypothetical protein
VRSRSFHKQIWPLDERELCPELTEALAAMRRVEPVHLTAMGYANVKLPEFVCGVDPRPSEAAIAAAKDACRDYPQLVFVDDGIGCRDHWSELDWVGSLPALGTVRKIWLRLTGLLQTKMSPLSILGLPLAYCVLLGAWPLSAAAPQRSALGGVVKRFCRLQAADGLGEPAADLASSALRQAIRAALLVRARDIKAAPDEKPALGDGIPYRSYPDVPSSCTAGKVVRRWPLTVSVRYSIARSPGSDWTDRLVLERDRLGRYRVDDVLYGAEGYKQGLRATLDGLATQPTSPQR